MFKAALSVARKLQRFIARPLPDKWNSVHDLFCRLKTRLYYRGFFAHIGEGSAIHKPMMLSNPRYMSLGRNVIIRKGVRLEAILSDVRNPPHLEIGDNVNIEQNVHIVCHSRIVIGNDVSITGPCAIVDVNHPYESLDSHTKIGARISSDRSFVEIGEGSFLGFGAVILPNVRIGRSCVVGSNAVVTRDVPDRSVVAGNPAKVIRQYNDVRGEWMRVGEQENETGKYTRKDDYSC